MATLVWGEAHRHLSLCPACVQKVRQADEGQVSRQSLRDHPSGRLPGLLIRRENVVHVASELEREGFDLPLLIGGATTSRVHTAVKINPRYSLGQTVYVTDASRAVGVVSSLLSPEVRDGYKETVRAEYLKVAEAHAA